MKQIDSSTSGQPMVGYEETLRLLVNMPVPAGLAARVQAKVDAAPSRRFFDWRGRIAAPRSNWMRSLAAAAIMILVVGGGWQISSRMHAPAPASGAINGPNRPASGGFSSAGAMRTPQTLNRQAIKPGAEATASPQPAVHPSETTKHKKSQGKSTPARRSGTQVFSSK